MLKPFHHKQFQLRGCPKRCRRDSGHLLLAILLMMALMIIAATYEAPRLVQQIKRDREEEMIHRGTEYARAIRKYYRKFGRYPANLEQLDDTNNMRFIRKRYKDPLTKNGEWKLLHYGDVASILGMGNFGAPAAAMATLGQQTAGAPGFSSPLAGTNQTGQTSVPVSGGPGSLANAQGATGSGGFGNDISQQNASASTGTVDTTQTAQNTTSAVNAGFGPSNSGIVAGQPGATNSTSLGTGPATIGGNPVFGGGAIVGVASLSKDPTIRIYNKKKTYDEWVFIYAPMLEPRTTTGSIALLRGPYSPTYLSNNTNIGTPAGQLNQQPNQQQSPFGQQNTSGYGQQSGNQQPNNPGQGFPPEQNQQ